MHRTHVILYQKSGTIESQTEWESEILQWIFRTLSFVTWASDLSKILIFSSLTLSFCQPEKTDGEKQNDVMIELQNEEKSSLKT